MVKWHSVLLEFNLSLLYRIAPTSNRLQTNMYGNVYSEFMDYSAIDAFLNPGYGGATRIPAGRLGNQDANVDLLV
jgi:hypothetical protein